MTMPTAAIHAGSVPLPAEWLQALGLDEGTKVALILENGRIISQPMLANSLDELRLKFASDRDVVAELQEERRQDKW